MALILLCWFYILFTSLAFGVGFSKLFRLQTFDIVITNILGLFSITLLASVWAFFGSINVVFHLLVILITVLLGFYNRKQLFAIFQDTKSQILSLSDYVILLLVVSSILIWAQCASFPFIIDNETYYIQTIKWLNEYGFVPGLANLHLFLGQTSGWHITQSVFSFSFLYDRFNDLNGYCLLIGNYWALKKLHSYFETKNRIDLVLGFLPLTYAFYFQFISSPSPDFPVYIFGFILFSLYLESSSRNQKETFTFITTIALYLVYIKITAAVLLFFPLLFLFKNYAVLKTQLFRIGLLSGFVFVLFVAKNAILTGYPLFPMTFISLPGVNYGVPKEIIRFFFSQGMMHSFYFPSDAFDSASLFSLLKNYFFYNGLDSGIAIATVVLLAISPVVITKHFPRKKVWDIYVAFVFLLLLLLFSSPQYRFYVYFTLFFGLLLLSTILTNRKMIVSILGLSMVVVIILVFVPLSFRELTANKSLAKNSTFNLENIITPKPNTKLEQKFTMLSEGNLKYYSPIEYPFFWITGNGNLPCVNAEQLKYFETYFHVIPQQRTADLKDGFYSKKITTND